MAFAASDSICCNWLLHYFAYPLLGLLRTHHCRASPSLLLMHLAAALQRTVACRSIVFVPFSPIVAHILLLRALCSTIYPLLYCYIALRCLLRCDRCIALNAAFYCIMPFALQFCMHRVPFALLHPIATYTACLQGGPTILW